MLLPVRFQPLVDGNFYGDWIQGEFAHCRIEHVGLFMHQRLKDVFDGDEILIPLARLIQRKFQYTLATIPKFVFIRT